MHFESNKITIPQVHDQCGEKKGVNVQIKHMI
jgi:hypothetical protein